VPIHQAFCLPKKLENTKVALLKWNCLHFGNIYKKIKETLNLLDFAQKIPPTQTSFELEISLKVDLENLMVKEETLWRLKSKEAWLTCKDLNTKYFHHCTLIRRRSNAVDFLKLDSGIWVSSRFDIGENFTAHFTNIFITSNPLIKLEILNLFPPIIFLMMRMSFLVLFLLKRKFWKLWPALVLLKPQVHMGLQLFSTRSTGVL
jgi:hypothetical protein